MNLFLRNPQYQGLLILLCLMILLPMVFGGSLFYNIANTIGIRSLLCLGLGLLLGFAGQISLGHAGFYAIGAYGSALLTSRIGLPSLLAILVAALIAALVAFIIGRSILRLKGHLLAMATLAMGMMIYIVLNHSVPISGGPDGMSVSPLGIGDYVIKGEFHWYLVICAALFTGVWFSINLVQSPIGRALLAMKGSEVAAEVSGVDIGKYKLLIFVISAIYASVAGSLYAHYHEFITPGEADLLNSFEMLIVVLLGGMGSIFGPIIGAAVLVSLPHLLTRFHDFETLIFGVILVLIVMFLPKGLLPTINERFGRRSA